MLKQDNNFFSLLPFDISRKIDSYLSSDNKKNVSIVSKALYYKTVSLFLSKECGSLQKILNSYRTVLSDDLFLNERNKLEKFIEKVREYSYEPIQKLTQENIHFFINKIKREVAVVFADSTEYSKLLLPDNEVSTAAHICHSLKKDMSVITATGKLKGLPQHYMQIGLDIANTKEDIGKKIDILVFLYEAMLCSFHDFKKAQAIYKEVEDAMQVVLANTSMSKDDLEQCQTQIYIYKAWMQSQQKNFHEAIGTAQKIEPGVETSKPRDLAFKMIVQTAAIYHGELAIALECIHFIGNKKTKMIAYKIFADNAIGRQEFCKALEAIERLSSPQVQETLIKTVIEKAAVFCDKGQFNEIFENILESITYVDDDEIQNVLFVQLFKAVIRKNDDINLALDTAVAILDPEPQSFVLQTISKEAAKKNQFELARDIIEGHIFGIEEKGETYIDLVKISLKQKNIDLAKVIVQEWMKDLRPNDIYEAYGCIAEEIARHGLYDDAFQFIFDFITVDSPERRNALASVTRIALEEGKVEEMLKKAQTLKGPERDSVVKMLVCHIQGVDNNPHFAAQLAYTMSESLEKYSILETLY